MGLGEQIRLEDLERDPDPLLAQLRETEPVCWVPSMNMWLVTRWHDVAFMDAHPEVFSATTEPSFLRRALGENMLTLDAPEAARLKNAMAAPFQRSGGSGDFAEHVLPRLCDSLIDSFVDDGEVDIMERYCQAVSSESLRTVLGLDLVGWEAVWDWCEGLCADISNFENDPARARRGQTARQELGEAIDRKIDTLREKTDGSALAHMLRVDAGGRPLSRDEIINNVRLMVSGGINEPRDGIGLTMMVVLSDSELAASLRLTPALWRRVVDETLRLHSPVGTITRQTTSDTELGGETIPRGALVSGVLRSANRDERRWEAPEEFRAHRTEGGHAAFALGQHRCLGEWLGRQEIRVGSERLMARLANVRLCDSNPELVGFEFRGPRSLRLAWDVARPSSSES